MAEALKIVGLLGTVFIVLTLVFNLMPKWPRMPGDIHFEKFGFSIYIPWLSSLIVSVLFTLYFNFFTK